MVADLPRVAAIVQRVVWNRVIANVGPDLALAPIGQRIEFRQRVHGIEFLEGHLRAWLPANLAAPENR